MNDSYTYVEAKYGMNLHVQEYDQNGQKLLLLRASAGPGGAVTLGIDLTPEQALQLSAALKLHAEALLAGKSGEPQ
jgi:hypothetical protein